MKAFVLTAAIASAALAGSSNYINKVDTERHANLFEQDLMEVGVSLMQTPWSDTVRQQYDTVRQDILNLDLTLEQVRSTDADIQAKFASVDTDFQAFHRSADGLDVATELNQAVSAFSQLKVDITRP